MPANKPITFLVIGICFISSCSDDQKIEKLRYLADHENQVAWNENYNSNIIAQRDAPSGKYVSAISKQSPYSMTLNLRTKQISDDVLKEVLVKAKVKITSARAEPLLVVDIRDQNGVSLEWLSTGLEDKNSSYNKWVEMNAKIDLTIKGRNKPENIFRIYVANGEKDTVFVDDIEVIFKN